MLLVAPVEKTILVTFDVPELPVQIMGVAIFWVLEFLCNNFKQLTSIIKRAIYKR